MTRFLRLALAGLLLLPSFALAAGPDKPMVMDSGVVRQLPPNVTVQLNAAGPGNASVNLPHGTAPTSPVDGDCWTTTSGFFCRINGVTIGPYLGRRVALTDLAQIGGNSYLGNTSTTTGDVTAYALPTCTTSDHTLHYNPTGGAGFQCDAIGAVSTGSNPFYIGAPNISSGTGTPAASSYPAGSLFMRTDSPRLYELMVSAAAVPAVVQSTSGGSNSATFVSTPAAGDYLVAFCQGWASTPTAAAGWTASGYTQGTHVFSPSAAVNYKLAASGESTTQTPCSGAYSVTIYEVSGVTSWAASYAGVADNFAGSGGSDLAVSLTTTSANELLLGDCSSNADSGTGSIAGLTLSATGAVGGGVSSFGAAGQFVTNGSSVSVTCHYTSGNGTYIGLLKLVPGASSWAPFSFLSTIKNAGADLETNPLSFNCGSGLTCSTDGAGNVTATATGAVTTTGSPATGNLAKFSGATSVTSGDLSGDCTTSGTLAVTCTKTSGSNFGTLATQNAPTGSTQCVQVNSSGVVSGTGSACGSASGAAISGTPTTGNCVKWINATTIGDQGAACGGGSSTAYFPGPYTVPAASDFPTWVNQGAATATDLSSSGGLLLCGPASSGDNIRAMVRSAPATPYTITAYLVPMHGGGSFTSAGLLWRESSSGKLVNGSVDWVRQPGSSKYNSVTSFNASYTISPLLTIQGAVGIRISDDGTTRKVFASPDGVAWIQISSQAHADFITPDQVGIYVNSNNSSQAPCVLVKHWG